MLSMDMEDKVLSIMPDGYRVQPMPPYSALTCGFDSFKVEIAL